MTVIEHNLIAGRCPTDTSHPFAPDLSEQEHNYCLLGATQ
jgi:hypothetical protein